jgi:hypothetical protein
MFYEKFNENLTDKNYKNDNISADKTTILSSLIHANNGIVTAAAK